MNKCDTNKNKDKNTLAMTEEELALVGVLVGAKVGAFVGLAT
jgi:hypothetical protein